jgi:hypothetical protein
MAEEHSEHPPAHGRHMPVVASAYVPSGQRATQLPPERYVPSSQVEVKQLVANVQVAQGSEHGRQPQSSPTQAIPSPSGQNGVQPSPEFT